MIKSGVSFGTEACEAIRKNRHSFFPVIFAPVKIFAFIMAVMILALGALPCMDEPYVISEANRNTRVAETNNTGEHNDTDACSPFCACNCCSSGFTFLISAITNQLAVFAQAKMYASYLPSAIIEISLPVWQPPQLA